MVGTQSNRVQAVTYDGFQISLWQSVNRNRCPWLYLALTPPSPGGRGGIVITIESIICLRLGVIFSPVPRVSMSTVVCAGNAGVEGQFSHRPTMQLDRTAPFDNTSGMEVG